jgi:hypothetical protein
MYLDSRLKICNIKGKGKGIITRDIIKKGEILIKDTPVTIKHNFTSDMFCMLHNILMNQNDIIEKFMNLYPKSLQDYSMDPIIKKRILDEFKRLKTIDITIHRFFSKNYTMNQILLYCAKYICNAFEFNNAPAFLFTGTILNHSCLPNVIFGVKDGLIVFVAARDINKNEEILDNYINITLKTSERRAQLKQRYGFMCECTRCISNCHIDVNEIELYRKKLFGSRHILL